MAYTQTDLDNIKAAIAGGELTVRKADGSMVTWRTMAELIQAKNAIEVELNTASTTVMRPRYQQASFSD
ncbi:MAG: hypothetical protein DIZ78_09430 [endosymbiont of Escarpia spicata]|uniref:Uncharacterized protein n=1 Tax=endosymbiont of Escarpia spicata TaxID=2200908 RepID=A0A370DP88_9GAMM|nr:MAG: hypothetical protein DIZ78_09430 [endosymbiont of Escarpia spicata]